MTDDGPLERVVTWIECHPRTLMWVVLMTTLNFILGLLDAIGVF